MENNSSNRRLQRTYPRVLAGVCAGVAEYFGLKIGSVRIAFVLLCWAVTPLLYIILWIIMPSAPRRVVAHHDPKQLEK